MFRAGTCSLFWIMIFALGLGIEIRPPAQPDAALQLYTPRGQAPKKLRKIKTWKYTKSMSFDTGTKTKHLVFNQREIIQWMERRYGDPTRNTTSPKRNLPLQTWASVLKMGESYNTYKIDVKNSALLLKVLVPVGKNQWYYVTGQPKRAITEILFAFDSNPLQEKTGKVTITRPHHETVKLTAPYRVEHYPDSPLKKHQTWIIRVDGGNHSRYTMHYQRHENGLTFFVPNSTWGHEIYYAAQKVPPRTEPNQEDETGQCQ